MPVSRTKLISTYNALAGRLTPHQQYGVLEYLFELLDHAYTKAGLLRCVEQVRARERREPPP